MSDIAAGRGRTQLVDQRALRLGLLRGPLAFLRGHTDADGATLCPVHGVEHTGRLAATALLNDASWRFTREEDHLIEARQRLLRAVDQLGRDGASEGMVFLPGGADPASPCSHAEESGAAVDALADLLGGDLPGLDADETQRCREAVALCADETLLPLARHAESILDRLWAAVGLARAARWLERDAWGQQALDTCRQALERAGAEGVLPVGGAAHVSTVNQSKLPAFVLAVHTALEQPFDDFITERVAAGADTVMALRSGGGCKLLGLDAEAGLWTPPYEVVSHPFDAYALHRSAQSFPEHEHAAHWSGEAGRVMEEWVAHVAALDGGLESHHGKPKGTGHPRHCRLLATADASWVARILHDVPLNAAARPDLDVVRPDAGLVHIERHRGTAVWRGAQGPAVDAGGPACGGGTLVSWSVQPDARIHVGVERVATGQGGRTGRASASPGFEWHGAGRGWGRVLGSALGGLLGGREPVACTAWDLRTELKDTALAAEGGEVVFIGGMADRAGEPMPGVATERTWTLGPAGMELIDAVSVAAGRGTLVHRLPGAWQDVQVEAQGGKVTRSEGEVRVRGEGGALSLVVRARWPS